MADLEQSLAELESVKQAFKTNINSNGVSTSGIEFRSMPNLLKQMEKKLPSQTKTVDPTTSSQSVSADAGYKLTAVNINAVKPSDYYKPEESITIQPKTTPQVINPPLDHVFNLINVPAVTSTIDGNIKEENIKKGVTILGVTGTMEASSGGSSKFAELVDGSITSVDEIDLARVETIKFYAFGGCQNLASVKIPSNVKTIGDGAFEACANLQTLSLAEGIEKIGATAFAGINAPINLPSTLTEVGNSAFAGNQALTSITIPSGLTVLSADMFAFCQNLTDVTMLATTPPIVGVDAFPENVVRIYVPYSAYDDYMSSSYWSGYTSKIVRLPAIPSTITVTVNNYLGELVSGASVTITGNDQTYTGTTDSVGVFSQGDLQPATYTISVADLEGFKTPSSSEVVVEEDTQNSVMFTYLEETRYVITFPSGVTVKNGNVQLTSGDSVLYGTNLTIGYTLSEHHHLTEFKVNGVDAVNNSTITITSDTTITFAQAIDTYSVTFGAGVSVLNGGVSLTSGDVVPYGTSLVVGYTLTEGYKLTSFQVNGVDTENNATITVTSNIEITFAEEKESSGGGDVAFSRTFSENSPAVISQIGTEISNAGMTSAEVESTYGWKIGDTTSYTLSTGENVEMRIIGFNHDDLSDGSGKKAGITLEMTHCLAQTCSINSEKTTTGGYPASVIRNTTLPTIKATIPQEWQDVIVKVDKKSANGGGTSYTETVTSSEDLFLLSEIEVCGTAPNAQDGANEGSVYEYWNGKSNTDRIKKYDTDADGVIDKATTWWLRSILLDMTEFCRMVYSGNGNVSNSYATDLLCLSYAFCVGGGSSSGGDTPDTPSFSRTFSENTPAQISAVSDEISANNMNSAQVAETYGWNIGDTTTIPLSTGENIEMRIIGFNHDDKSDGSGKAGITLEMTHCLKTKYPFGGNARYDMCDLNKTTLPTIKTTLPQSWQEVISSVKKTVTTNVYTGTTQIDCELFILGEVELYYRNYGSNGGSNEGKIYEYWSPISVDSERVRKIDTNNDGIPDSNNTYHLRTYSTDQNMHCGYSFRGTGGTTLGYTEDSGVSFAFCI